MNITGCMIVKNESENISKSLACLSGFVDDIIVVDNNSTDDTVEKAKKFGCKIIDGSEYVLDQARNLYLDASKTEWNFILDADEYILESDCYKVKQAVKTIDDPQTMYFYMPRFEYLGTGKWATIGAPRLYRNHPQIRYNNFIVHASVTPAIVGIGGKAKNIYTPIHHYDILIKDRSPSKREGYINRIKEEIYYNQANPFIWTQYTHLANEYVATERFVEAERLFKHAISLSNYALIQATTGLATLYLETKAYDNCYNEVVKIIDHPTAMKDRALTILSRWAYETNQIDKSIEYCEKIIELDENSPHTYLNLAFLYAKRSPSKALDLIKKAILLNPMILRNEIYGKGHLPNMFNHQTSFISKDVFLFDTMLSCYNETTKMELSSVWNDLWDSITKLRSEIESLPVFR